jgi:Mor family transcriptional regulator
MVLHILYHARILQSPTIAERDARIRERHAAGESISDLAREFGASPQRVWQIVNMPIERPR